MNNAHDVSDKCEAEDDNNWKQCRSMRLLFVCSPQNRVSWKRRQWHIWRFHFVRRRLGGCGGRTMFVRRTDRGGSTYVRADTPADIRMVDLGVGVVLTLMSRCH